MRNITLRFRQSFIPVFARAGYRLIGGTTGPYATQSDAHQALLQRRMLQTREIRNPFAGFVLCREMGESDPTDDEWLQIVDLVLVRIGAADAMWWAFVDSVWRERPCLHIYALLIDSTGKPVATQRHQWASLNADGSRRERLPKDEWLALNASGGAS